MSGKLTLDADYWTPSLYFAFANGSFAAVPQEVGATIYYLFRSHPDDEGPIQAFPVSLSRLSRLGAELTKEQDGYRMLTGDPYVRSYDENSLMAQAIGWNCLGSSMEKTKNPFLPPENCPVSLTTAAVEIRADELDRSKVYEPRSCSRRVGVSLGRVVHRILAVPLTLPYLPPCRRQGRRLSQSSKSHRLSRGSECTRYSLSPHHRGPS